LEEGKRVVDVPGAPPSIEIASPLSIIRVGVSINHKVDGKAGGVGPEIWVFFSEFLGEILSVFVQGFILIIAVRDPRQWYGGVGLRNRSLFHILLPSIEGDMDSIWS
jgi:hypothetical protein